MVSVEVLAVRPENPLAAAGAVDRSQCKRSERRGALPKSSPYPLAAWSLATAILVTHTPAAERWPDERSVGPFSCHADFALDGSSALLDEMMQLQRDVGQLLRVHPEQERIHVFLFSREGVYRQYVNRYFPHVPYRRALYIKERGPGMIFAYASDQLDVDLRHECTHAILHAALAIVPLWLDEGLAEYFEVPAADRAYRNPHLPKMKWRLFFGRVMPLERLEAIERIDDMGANEYRQAWAWVHFMLHGPPAAQEELLQYLSDIQARRPPGDLSRRLRQRIPDLEKAFSAHFTQWRR